MFKNWLKIAFTNYKKNWLSTIINVFGLSLGLCIFLLIFINWQDEKSYEEWVPNKENIYLVENTNPIFGAMVTSSFPELSESTKKYPEIEDFTIANMWSSMKIKLSVGQNSSFSNNARVSESFFNFFPFEKVAGSYQDALKGGGKMAISEETAKKLFGDEYKNCIGKTVKMDSNEVESYIVTAVYKLPKENSVFKPDFVMLNPNFLKENKYDKNWTNYSYVGYFKLKPGADPNILAQKITKDLNVEEKITAEKYGQPFEEKDKSSVHLTRLDKMKLDALSEGVEKGDKKSILILLGLSILILVLSAINLINLKSAQSSQRAKEVGVRKALGSSQWRLIIQFWLESFIICFVAYIIAFGMIELILPFYNKFLNKEIVTNNPKILIYSAVFLFIFSLFAGVLPAAYLSNFKPINTLKGNFSRSKNGVWLRNSILTFQLIISSFFIICSAIIYSQVSYMLNKDLGFKGDQVIQIDFKKINYDDDYVFKKNKRLKAELLKIAGVEDITSSVFNIGNGMMNTSNVSDAKDTTKIVNLVGCGGVDYNFVDFYKLKIISGRNLDLRKASDTISGTLANEAFIKKMGWNKDTAIGKEVLPGWEDGAKRKYTILGVVKDFYITSVSKEVDPLLLFNYDRNWIKNNVSNLQIKISKNDIGGTIARIKDFWENKAEPGYPFEYNFVDKKFAKTFEKFEQQKTLFSILNTVVLIVALLGLFALSSLLIEQKLKDIAIKKTLGADEKIIVWDLTKKFLIITIIAVLLSFPLAYYAMNEWLKDFAYRIEMPWIPYVISLILLLILTFGVVSIKAFQATKLNLVKYLKYE